MTNYLEEYGYHTYLAKAKETLKPCPFCGGQPIYYPGFHAGYDEETGTIECKKCRVAMRVRLYGYGKFEPEKAFYEWNRREHEQTI